MLYHPSFTSPLRNEDLPARAAACVYTLNNRFFRHQACYKAGSLKMNTALEYSTRVVQEGGRRCKKSTLNDLVHLTPLRIPLMNPPTVCFQPSQADRRTASLVYVNIRSLLNTNTEITEQAVDRESHRLTCTYVSRAGEDVQLQKTSAD
jgi:hypothetical protein